MRTGRYAPHRRAVMLVLCALFSVTTAGCTVLDNFLASIPIFSFLRESPAFDPYEAPRPPPVGAIPFEAPSPALPPLEPSQRALAAFGATVTNPVPVTPETLEQGQVLYIRFCAVCHGPTGHGDGPVIGPGKFPLAPDLTLPVTVQRSDGYIYGIIRVGRGLMPPYGGQIPSHRRWLIVNYVRQLQQAADTAGTAQAADTAETAQAADTTGAGQAADTAGFSQAPDTAGAAQAPAPPDSAQAAEQSAPREPARPASRGETDLGGAEGTALRAGPQRTPDQEQAPPASGAE